MLNSSNIEIFNYIQSYIILYYLSAIILLYLFFSEKNAVIGMKVVSIITCLYLLLYIFFII
jgi:hypothetical protein